MSGPNKVTVPDYAPSVVTGDASKTSPNSHVVIGSLAVLVLAGIALFVWYEFHYGFWKSAAPHTAQSFSSVSRSDEVAFAQAQLSNAKTPAQKQVAFAMLGAAYLNNLKYAQSAAAYKRALTYAPNNVMLLESLSTAYQLAGDKPNAIATLQQLIRVMNDSNVSNKAYLLPRYQALLQQLEEGS